MQTKIDINILINICTKTVSKVAIIVNYTTNLWPKLKLNIELIFATKTKNYFTK